LSLREQRSADGRWRPTRERLCEECGRAHSLGAAGQLLDLIGFSLMVNSVAIRRHRAKHAEPVALAA
jgi:hypothetical protein